MFDRSLAALVSPRSRLQERGKLSRKLVLALVLAMLVSACGEPIATPEPVFLRAAGSTAMSPLAVSLAAGFGQQASTVSLEVTGLGTQFGLEALRAGEADLALASWLPPEPSRLEQAGDGLTQSRRGLEPDWQAVAIARDGIAVIVHTTNPLEGLGLLQLRDLFSGRAYEWQAVGGRRDQGWVQPVSREEGSGTRAAFEILVMEDLVVTPRAVMVPSSQAVIEYVAEHPESIGYVSMAHLVPDVKVLGIEGELPDPESASQGIYPLVRELWLVTAEPAPEAVQDFVDFALGPAGQQIVGQFHGRIK
jgi:phosphate transport system substrate-binding protein